MRTLTNVPIAHSNAGFVNGVRERLLAINVLAELHGSDGRDRVRMIGRGHDHRVDVVACRSGATSPG
jgi:hypothetical protein